MLTQLDEYRPILLENAQSPLRAALVACLDHLVAFFWREGFLVEGISVAGHETRLAHSFKTSDMPDSLVDTDS